jgi:hypothetical protein
VDGSKIARNPSRPSTGIATVGKPFVLGGTQSSEVFGQGFYGYLGCLPGPGPKEFLAPCGE